MRKIRRGFFIEEWPTKCKLQTELGNICFRVMACDTLINIIFVSSMGNGTGLGRGALARSFSTRQENEGSVFIMEKSYFGI